MPSIRARLKLKHMRENCTFLRVDAQPRTGRGEHLPKLWITRSAECICEDIVMGRYPSWFPKELSFQLEGGKGTRHSKPQVNTRLPISEQVKASLIIGMTADVKTLPVSAPETSSQEVGDKLEITDMPISELSWDCASEILARGMVETTEAWLATVPAIGAGVEGYFA